jgi:hypothetical protein
VAARQQGLGGKGGSVGSVQVKPGSLKCLGTCMMQAVVWYCGDNVCAVRLCGVAVVG